MDWDPYGGISFDSIYSPLQTLRTLGFAQGIGAFYLFLILLLCYSAPYLGLRCVPDGRDISIVCKISPPPRRTLVMRPTFKPSLSLAQNYSAIRSAVSPNLCSMNWVLVERPSCAGGSAALINISSKVRPNAVP